MQNSPNENDFISGVHNYCDRWCERCEFASRCEVFADERVTAADGEPGPDELVKKLSEIFADTKKMLLETAEEMGIDPFAISDEEFAEIRKREKRFVDDDELSHLAERYWRSARELLKKSDDWLPADTLDEMTFDALEVLYWYLFFIAAKINRGLRGLLDDEGFEDREVLLDSQSDANGSIKVGLIAIERSILAWTSLLEISNFQGICPMIELLDKIKRLLETTFPLARDFIRPGFDEVQTVM